MFTGCVNVDVGEMPPLRKALAVVNAPKARTTTRNATVEPDAVSHSIGIVVEIVIDRNGLSDAQGVTFNCERVSVNELIPRTKAIFVFHPMNV